MTEVAKLPRSEVVSSSAMDQRGYLSWVNSTLDTNVEKVEEMCTGVAYCQLMHRMFPDSISLIGVKFDARSEQEYRNNFTIMKQCFSQLKVNKSLPIALLCRGNFWENFDFLKWFKAFFDVNTEPHSDNNPCEERESSHFLQPNNAQYLPTQSRRSLTPTPRSTSPMMNCVPPQSATPEPPSWSQRATSPFGGSVPSQNAHRAPRDGEIISVPKLSTANSFCNPGAAVDVGLCRMGGYDFQFCGNIDGFCCLLCLKVMREPIQIPCGHHYCKSCISDYVKTQVNCRGCNREIVSNHFFPDTYMHNRISNLIVRCPNLICSCVCSLSAIEDHLQICSMNTLHGFNMDSIKCKYCCQQIEVQYLRQHRDPSEFKCHKMPRRCPYDCPVPVTLEDLRQHLEDNVVQHAQYHQQQLSELKSENNSLKKQLQSLQQSYFETKVTPTLSEENWDYPLEEASISTNGVVIWAISNFKRIHPYAEIHSQPFYTAPKGFKLRCYVPAVDNCVRVYIQRLEGRFDSILSTLVLSSVQIAISNKKQPPENLVYNFPCLDHLRFEQISPMELDFQLIKHFLGESESAVLKVTVVPL